MSRQYKSLVARGGAKEACWRLICHCVQAIFGDLHKARIAGRGPFLGSDRASGIMWGSLQAHRLMQEYVITSDFAAHPKYSHILNIHLQDNALMKADYKTDMDKVKVKARVVDLEKNLAILHALHDQLSTKVGKLKK
jgi:hypothetical protein